MMFFQQKIGVSEGICAARRGAPQLESKTSKIANIYRVNTVRKRRKSSSKRDTIGLPAIRLQR
jgi:hypothetical protein